MDLARFEAIVAAYGAERARWPDAERDAALAFALADARAAELFREARTLDDLLDADADAAPANLALSRRLFETMARPPRIPVARIAAALAACAVIGFGAGYLQARQGGDDEAAAALGMAFGEGFEG
ncbi:MAG: hypothetical protein ABUS57_07670 [Pseudomonadota bacterium]